MSLTIAEWHQRYQQQAGWSAELRRHIYSFPWFQEAQYIIELGCGTAAILNEMQPFGKKCVLGLDIDNEPLLFASSLAITPNLVQADAYSTPFPDSTFDISFCHYLLLWTQYPHKIISEMVRITKTGGWILALAEPDYGGRIDYPPALEALGKMQIQSLSEQGANPYIGRTLKSLFNHSNISDVVYGIFGAQWSSSDVDSNSLENVIYQSDYDLLTLSPQSMSKSELISLQQYDQRAWQNQTRVLFIPTFYAWGKVNKS